MRIARTNPPPAAPPAMAPVFVLLGSGWEVAFTAFPVFDAELDIADAADPEFELEDGDGLLIELTVRTLTEVDECALEEDTVVVV